MKKALFLSALALTLLLPTKVFAKWPVPIERPTPWTIITSTEAVANGMGMEDIKLIGGKTGFIADVIDDNPYTYWHSNWNQCDGTQENHVHWFMIDRGEDAATVPFTTIAFQQRVCQVNEGQEESAEWNGAVDTADIYLMDENPGLVGGYDNMTSDFNAIAAYRNANNPTLDVDVDIYQQNPQFFEFKDADNNVVSHTERYILVVLTHTVNPTPNQDSNPADKFACLAGCNLYGTETYDNLNAFPEPYANPWSIDDLKKNTRGDRVTYALNFSGGVDEVNSPYLQKACYRWFEHDDTCYDLTEFFTYQAYSGSTITITPRAAGSWMQNYVYIDWDSDGFETHENQGDFLNEDATPVEGSDLVWYAWSSLSSGKNSTGGNATDAGGGTYMNGVCTFTIPENTPAGKYRARYKTDWDNLNPTLAVTYKDGALEKNGAVVVDFYIEVLSSDEPASEQMIADAQAVASKGNVIKAINVSSDEALTAWNNAIAALEEENPSAEDVLKIAPAYERLLKEVKNVSISVHHGTRTSSYWGVKNDTNGDLTCSGNVKEGSNAFTLEMADDNSGFYLYNEHTGGYIVHPHVLYSQVEDTKTKANASIYNFDVWTIADGSVNNTIGFHSINSGARKYLHSNADETMVGWDFDGDNSTWVASLVDDKEAAHQHLAGKLASIGSGLGRYSVTDGDSDAAEAVLNNESATTEQLREAAASFSVELNKPIAGRFYRLHFGNKYMSSEITDYRFSMKDYTNHDALDNKTVFYYDGTHLVTFPDGLIMGNLTSNNRVQDFGSYVGVVGADNTLAGSVQFSEANTSSRKYFVSFTSDRCLFHQSNYIDAGGSTNIDDGYKWEIEEVTWLPIPHDGGKYLAFYSPVALEKSLSRIGGHHSGSISLNSSFVKETQTHENIPANTPFLLEYKEEGGMSNNCVYLQIQYPSESSVALFSETENSSDLNGSHLAQNKAENTTYFTVSGEKFVPHTGNYVPGFTAHLAVPSATAAAEYAIEDPVGTGISEVGVDAGADKVYDLQGRKVAKASKGLYIINGKKVIVK